MKDNPVMSLWNWAVLPIVLLSLSCQQDKEEAVPQPTSQVVGFWQGIQSTAVEGAENQVKKSEFVFETNQSFQMRIVDDSQEAKGVYTDFFRTKNLFLEITESTAPSLGLKGSGRDFIYELVEDELLLKAERVTYKLKRREDVPAQTPKSPILGEWIGRDSNDNDWRLVLDNTAFTLMVTRTRSRSIVMSGDMQILSQGEEKGPVEAKIVLNVTRSSPSRPIERMIAILSGDGTKRSMAVYRAQADNKPDNPEPMARLTGVNR